MPTNWKTPYEAALRERDPAKLPEACELARHAIVERELELSTLSEESPERLELEEALRQVWIHEQRCQRPN
jgi:hypothetical protein